METKIRQFRQKLGITQQTLGKEHIEDVFIFEED